MYVKHVRVLGLLSMLCTFCTIGFGAVWHMQAVRVHCRRLPFFHLNLEAAPAVARSGGNPTVRVEPHETLGAHGALRPLFVWSRALHLHLLLKCVCVDHAHLPLACKRVCVERVCVVSSQLLLLHHLPPSRLFRSLMFAFRIPLPRLPHPYSHTFSIMHHPSK